MFSVVKFDFALYYLIRYQQPSYLGKSLTMNQRIFYASYVLFQVKDKRMYSSLIIGYSFYIISMHEVNFGHQQQLLLWQQIIPRKSVDTVRIRNVLHYIFSDARIRKENQASLHAICSFNFFYYAHQLIQRSAVQLVIARDTSIF